MFLIALGMVQRVMAEVSPVWSTSVAVPGEQVMLYLLDTEVGDDFFSVREQPQVRQAGVRVLQSKAGVNPLDPNRAMVQVLPILLRPDKAGVLEVGDITVEYKSGRKQSVKVPPLPVLSTSQIKWYDTPVPYGALWYTSPQEPYVHQPVKAALKLFIPQDCFINNLPQMQSVGVKISTLQPVVQGVIAIVHEQLMQSPSAFARGQNWRTADFCGELTPFREGNTDIIGKILLARQRSFFSVNQQEVPLPTLSLAALPLPPGAPADFSDTVGNYSLSVKCDATALAMNEAVEVQITVRGSGNLQQLACPKPEDADSWKLVPATRKPIVSANGETVGMVFSQLMRPIAEVSGIPAFSLSYFDPSTMTYKRVASAPLALPWKESDSAGLPMMQSPATPPPAGKVPVEELSDIYDLIPPDDAPRSIFVLPRFLWYLLYLPALLIFAYLLRRGVSRRFASMSAARSQERELLAISHDSDPLSFLKRIGAFIESNIPQDRRDAELSLILRRRDDEAFRPEASPVISASERNSMLQSVRKALAHVAKVAGVLLLALLPLSNADDGSVQELYRGRQYSKALDSLQKLQRESGTNDSRADVIAYDIGTCQYRLGKPGPAALSFARALYLNPSFPEARANLAFIQRKEGALLPVRSEVDHLFTLLSCSHLWVATIVCTAALALCIALHLLLRRRASACLSVCSALFALLSLLCALDWVYYGTRESADLASLPPSDLAYVLQATPLRSAAAPDAPALMQLTPSSPVRLLAHRGSFSYIETATHQRGWVTSASIESLSPDSPPRLPILLRLR